MGVLDDIKDSIGGSSSGNSSGPPEPRSGPDTDFETGDFSNSRSMGREGNRDPGGTDFGGDGSMPSRNPQAGNQPPADSSGDRPGQNSAGQQGREMPVDGQNARQQNQGHGRGQGNEGPPQRDRQREGNSTGFQDSPNPQTGRPQEGATEPQLSTQTQKKMENAGLETPGEGNEEVIRKIESLGQKMDRVIDLLERLNDNLEHRSRSSSGGRHGGRR